MRNEEYWARRMELLSAALLDMGEDYINNLRRQYDGAVASVEEKILRWFKRFADNNGVSLAEARRLLNSRELREFLWTVEEYIEHGEENALDGRWMKELENASARVHISRLESLKLHLRQTAEELCGAQLRDVPALLEDIYREGFERTAFELQKGAGVGFGFQLPNSGAIEKVLSRPWTADDLTFSARIWDNRQKLVASVNANLTRMLMTGADVDETTAAIVKDMNTSRYRAERIVRTESAAFISAAQRDCFDELEVERYEIVETPDGRTCGVCGDLDGKVFEMKDYSVGSTAPPFHPNCRGCTAPYYEDMAGLSTRHARDIETGEAYEIPDNMTYTQWREKQKGLDKSAESDIIKVNHEEMPLNIQLFAEKDLKNQSYAALKKGIKSLNDKIALHESKINNPQKYVSNWNLYSEAQKKGLIKHWRKEIRNFENSIQNRKDELKKRGELK